MMVLYNMLMMQQTIQIMMALTECMRYTHVHMLIRCTSMFSFQIAMNTCMVNVLLALMSTMWISVMMPFSLRMHP